MSHPVSVIQVWLTAKFTQAKTVLQPILGAEASVIFLLRPSDPFHPFHNESQQSEERELVVPS